MARYNFGGDMAAFAIQSPSGNSNVVKAQPNTVGSVYAARTGGSALTDLLDSLGAATTTISTDSNGFVNRFQGPDGYTDLWADFGGGARFYLRANDGSASKAAFGVVTPAIPADYTALQAAADAAAAAGTRLVASGTITSSSTLTVSSDCDLSQMTYNYTGTGTAVQIGTGTSGAILYRRDIRLPDIINTSKVTTGWTGSTIGVKAFNTYGCTIRVAHVKGFVTGYYAYGLGTGNVYNDVRVLHMENNKRNLVVGAGTGGWSNSNTYHLGLLTHDSAEGTAVAGTRNILVETATNLVNANLFVGGSVEGNVAEYHLDCDGLYNRFDEIRWENSGGCRVIWQANAARNVISYGYTAQSIVETHVAGSSLNRVFSTGMSRIVGSTTKAVQWLENTSSSTAGADAIMDPGATLAGSDPTTAYRILRSADFTKMKRATDTNDRLMLDHTNGRMYFGNAAGAIAMYLAAVSTSGVKLEGGNLYMSPDNSFDIGAASLRPRDVFIGRDLAIGGKVGFNGTTPITKPAVTGSRGGNAALASLLTALANLGLITDSTTA